MLKLNRTTIEEANKHLEALHSRVIELETVIQDQHEALLAKDAFIQTKIQELSKQDGVIQDLRDKLEAHEKQIVKKDARISELERDLNVRNLEISAVKPKLQVLGELIKIIPQLKTSLSEMERMVEKAADLDSYGYVEVSESSSACDNGDNIESSPVKSLKEKPNGNNAYISDGSTITHKTEDACNHTDENSVSVGEMARKFVKYDRSKKFSVSEDDDEDDSSFLYTSTTDSKSRELYF